MTTQEEINILIGANKLLESDDLNGITRALIISRINDVIASLENKKQQNKTHTNMKNIIKTVWSCWDKIDRFVAIFSLIIIIAALCFMCTSCNAQPSINNIPNMEYYDASGEELDYDGAILFFADGVIDFVYHTQDNEYVIEYDDPDAFDPDNMIYNQDSNYYYIEIYCDSALFFEYLSYYNTITNKDSEFFDASEEYFIEEDYLSDGTSYYKLVKYATKKNL